MTCGQHKYEKTLYDKSVVGRAQSAGRRARRTATGLLAVGLLAGGTTVGMAPAQAAAYGGFNTMATAAPLKLEIFEPVLPVPTEPQAELNFSYTRVLGDSGPATRARASAMWPGAAVGEGLKTFGEMLGLPDALTSGGYPVQANAEYPGDPQQQSQEFFPGMVGKVDAGAKRTLAKVSYTSSDVSDGATGSGKAPSSNPLDALGQIFGAKSGPPASNPMGSLSLLIDYDGMTSVSSTDYVGGTVIATATSRIGELRLLGGLIKLTGVNVVTKVTSSLDGGAKPSQTVDIGGMTIAGQKFSYGPEGFSAMGKNTPVPGIPASAGDLLKQLGVAIEVPKPVVTKKGSAGSISAEAVRITLDTKPLRSKLPKLPIDDLVNGIPPLPGQANLLKGLLLSLNTIAPKLVLHVGSADVSATTVASLDLGGGAGPSTPGSNGGSTAGSAGGGSGSSGTSGTPGLDASAPAGSSVGSGNTNLAAVPVAKGLPPMGSVPMLLLFAGLALAGGVGWYLRRAGLLLFGGASSCDFGLSVGIPDLRKA